MKLQLIDIELAESVFNERIDKEIAHYAAKLAKRAFREAIKVGTEDAASHGTRGSLRSEAQK